MLLNTITSDYAKRCSALITPSQFQRNQFPVDIRRKMMVLHEGIDLELFKPSTIRLLDTPQLVITYVCRGLGENHVPLCGKNLKLAKTNSTIDRVSEMLHGVHHNSQDGANRES